MGARRIVTLKRKEIMAYRTTLTPMEFADAAASIGFEYLETSCHCTTYTRNGDLMSIEDPTDDVFEDLEIATDFRLTDNEMQVLRATKVKL